jgi:Icc protein
MLKQSESLNILQITDLHILPQSGDTLLGIDTEFYFHAIMEMAVASVEKIDLILVTGDLTQHPNMESYQRIYQKLKSYRVPTICLPGNHDDFNMMQKTLNAANVSCTKHIILGNWQIICLNSQVPGEQGGFIDHNEMAFLEDCLIKHPELYSCIAVHHHCLPIKSIWMDTMKISNGEEVFECLKNYSQVKLMINGHIHQALATIKNNIKIYGTPSTCFQFKPFSSEFELDRNCPGFRHIKLYPDGHIESEINRLSGQLNKLKLTSHGY